MKTLFSEYGEMEKEKKEREIEQERFENDGFPYDSCYIHQPNWFFSLMVKDV